MKLFSDALTNFPLICAGSAWLLAQVIKVFTGIFKQRKFSIVALLWGSGGMPSSHTASVCALVCACGLYTVNEPGVKSAAFAVAFVLCSIVMTDATGVRKEAGEHAKVLNYMMSQWFKPRDGEDTDEKLLRIDSVRRRVIEPLSAFAERISSAKTVRDQAVVLIEFLIGINMEKNLAERAAMLKKMGEE